MLRQLSMAILAISLAGCGAADLIAPPAPDHKATMETLQLSTRIAEQIKSVGTYAPLVDQRPAPAVASPDLQATVAAAVAAGVAAGVAGTQSAQSDTRRATVAVVVTNLATRKDASPTSAPASPPPVLSTAAPEPARLVARPQVGDVVLTAAPGFKQDITTWADDLDSFRSLLLAVNISDAEFDAIDQFVYPEKDSASAKSRLDRLIQRQMTEHREAKQHALSGLGDQATAITSSRAFRGRVSAYSTVMFRRHNLVVIIDLTGRDGSFDLERPKVWANTVVGNIDRLAKPG